MCCKLARKWVVLSVVLLAIVAAVCTRHAEREECLVLDMRVTVRHSPKEIEQMIKRSLAFKYANENIKKGGSPGKLMLWLEHWA